MSNEKLVNSLKILSKYRKDEKGGFVEAELIDRLQFIFLRKDYMDSDILKVLVMGQMNAGKSSLINAICDEKIAATDFMEMTSWVSRIFPSSEPICNIKYKDGRMQTLATEEFVIKSNNKMFSDNELKNFDFVDIGIVNPNLKISFIDTPGMGSTTIENEKRMIDALGDADVILWTVSSSEVGNIQEVATIQKLLADNTPLCTIVTKADQIEASSDDREELKEYLSNEVGVSSEHILFSSGADKGMNESIQKVYDHLKNEFSSNTKEVRQKAEMAFDQRMSGEIEAPLKIVLSRLEELKKQINLFREKTENIKDIINGDMKFELEKQFDENVFSSIQDEFAKNAKKVKGKFGQEEIQEIIKKCMESDKVNKQWSDLNEKVEGKVGEAWGDKIKEFKSEFDDIISDIGTSVNLDESALKESISLGEFFEYFKTAGVAGGAAAVGLSFYAAVLGPGAAQIGMGAALGAFAAPVVGAALAGGLAVWGYKKFSGQLDSETEEKYRVSIEGFREILKKDILFDQIFPQVEMMNHKICDSVVSEFEKGLLVTAKVEDIDDAIAEIEETFTKENLKLVG